jgi:transposase
VFRAFFVLYLPSWNRLTLNQPYMEKRQRKKRTQQDYSLAFKLQVVGEIERGELNYDQADRKYGIQGNTTVSIWMKKYASLAWKQNPTVTNKKTPEQRIKELEELLAREKEKVFVLNTAIDVADQMLEANIRKKYLPELLKKQKSKPKK